MAGDFDAKSKLLGKNLLEERSYKNETIDLLDLAKRLKATKDDAHGHENLSEYQQAAIKRLIDNLLEVTQEFGE